MGTANFPAATKFCNVHQRYSHFAAPPRSESPSREYQMGRANLSPHRQTREQGKTDPRARTHISHLIHASGKRFIPGTGVPGTGYAKPNYLISTVAPAS